MKSNLLNSFLLICFIVSNVNADIPVHCLQHQVAGQWDLELEHGIPFTSQKKEHLCGHELPDNADSSNRM